MRGRDASNPPSPPWRAAGAQIDVLTGPQRDAAHLRGPAAGRSFARLTRTGPGADGRIRVAAMARGNGLWSWVVRRRALPICASALLLVACRDPDAQAVEPAPTLTPVATPEVVVHPAAAAAARLVVHHAAELAPLDLAEVVHLDLAMSPADQVGHLAELDAATTCDALDLVALAARLPRLEELRISGCPSSIHAGLHAFGPRLRSLTLADITLDGVTIGNLEALGGLRELKLTRVEIAADSLDSLAALPIERCVLSHLAKDSPLAALLTLWPRSLREVVLEGQWAGHDAMTSLSKAESTEILELRDTRVGNFSLNQIKALPKLRDVTFEGTTFNDNSPLYFRDLPITRFVCNCPRIGDGALRTLRHTQTIEQLELRETSITPLGIELLPKLERLQGLVLLDRDIGAEGFTALASVPGLQRLELSGDVENARMPGLGALTGLRELRLRHPQLDDRVTEELAKLERLEVLDLAGSRISDVGLAHLGKLAALRELHLSGSRVTNRGLEQLAALSDLQILSLDHTDVVDEGLAAFVRHPSLRELRLDSTLVTDASIETLRSLPKLERVSLTGTVVSRAAIAGLADHPTLQAIDIEGLRD
jgi:Leucine-rich repeat (LRR) protein